MFIVIHLLEVLVLAKLTSFFAFLTIGVLAQDNYYPERTKGVLEQAQKNASNQVLCGRIKIKKGALPEVYEWFNTLKMRKEELLEAFAHEGLWLESVFLEHTKEDDYLIYYTRQDDLEKVYRVLAEMALPIRLFHVECWKKYCEECTVLTPLFDLQRQPSCNPIPSGLK